jgi:hypothetical protein
VSETDIFCHLQNQLKAFTPKNVVSAQGNCSPPLPIEVQLERKQNVRSILINPQQAASSPKKPKKKKKEQQQQLQSCKLYWTITEGK